MNPLVELVLWIGGMWAVILLFVCAVDIEPRDGGGFDIFIPWPRWLGGRPRS